MLSGKDMISVQNGNFFRGITTCNTKACRTDDIPCTFYTIWTNDMTKKEVNKTENPKNCEVMMSKKSIT